MDKKTEILVRSVLIEKNDQKQYPFKIISLNIDAIKTDKAKCWSTKSIEDNHKRLYVVGNTGNIIREHLNGINKNEFFIIMGRYDIKTQTMFSSKEQGNCVLKKYCIIKGKMRKINTDKYGESQYESKMYEY
jgi:hypothetical protein